MKELIKLYVIGGLCVSSITYIIAVSGVFSPIRNLISKLGKWFDDLIHCPFCLSFYVSLMFLWLVRYPEIFTMITGEVLEDSIFQTLLDLFCIMTISSLCHYVMLRAYKPIVEEAQIRRKMLHQQNRINQTLEERKVGFTNNRYNNGK